MTVDGDLLLWIAELLCWLALALAALALLIDFVIRRGR